MVLYWRIHKILRKSMVLYLECIKYSGRGGEKISEAGIQPEVLLMCATLYMHLKHEKTMLSVWPWFEGQVPKTGNIKEINRVPRSRFPSHWKRTSQTRMKIIGWTDIHSHVNQREAILNGKLPPGR